VMGSVSRVDLQPHLGWEIRYTLIRTASAASVTLTLSSFTRVYLLRGSGISCRWEGLSRNFNSREQKNLGVCVRSEQWCGCGTDLEPWKMMRVSGTLGCLHCLGRKAFVLT
jgi:hypothetical protein